MYLTLHAACFFIHIFTFFFFLFSLIAEGCIGKRDTELRDLNSRARSLIVLLHDLTDRDQKGAQEAAKYPIRYPLHVLSCFDIALTPDLDPVSRF